MGRIYLFSDVSVNPQLKVGFGAWLAIPESRLHADRDKCIADEPRLKQFAATSSTRLELETLLWALAELEMSADPPAQGALSVCTDSQCIAGLPGRRTKLENRAFIGTGKNRELSNAPLYRSFYKFHDTLRFEIIKLKGHSPAAAKTNLDRIFARVDKSARKALKIRLLRFNDTALNKHSYTVTPPGN